MSDIEPNSEASSAANTEPSAPTPATSGEPKPAATPFAAAEADAGAPAQPVASAATAAGTPRWVPACLVILAVLVVAQWWSAREQIGELRIELARRLQQGDLTNAEAKLTAKEAQDATRDLQTKVGVLESKQIESQSQQLALEQLYQDLSKNRDDWALAEIEQVLSTASQQLQLAGNVPGALIALQNADRSLSRSDKPQFIVIRRAIAKDIDRLKALPLLDTTGITLRLDSLISEVDGMPLLSDEKPSLPATQPKPVRRVDPKAPVTNGRGRDSQWTATLEDKWQSWSDEMWGEVRQLIRVRTVDTPDALLLSPTQAYYARENLKLRLLNARLALLSRNEGAFRSDLIAAQDEIGKYFDTRAKQTQVAQALLKQVQGSNLSIDMPTLAESLNAVRNYKAKP
jgi:uroporphyrin-3 C-methyltransferase/uroporphyrinogen III methyltransferase/synthase